MFTVEDSRTYALTSSFAANAGTPDWSENRGAALILAIAARIILLVWLPCGGGIWCLSECPRLPTQQHGALDFFGPHLTGLKPLGSIRITIRHGSVNLSCLDSGCLWHG